MKLFTRAFWATTIENALVAGCTAFAGALVLTTTPTVKDFVAAASAGGMAALYSFVKALGAVQAAKAAASKS